ncbi:SDR family oxidoreductase [Sphingobium sp. YR768]|uniref:SDR family oxidoreductase n=1 Tax=Sphingobium sp. YR768 TaxID=1884365 RepID=UPI0008D0411F|nr:SDR family oxidoreductase [Sphingobium sp. YR768]SER56368.1 cyclic-di-GMP-binding biofilm dispersal mediator protein [Sphingobium sp. YR768]
MMTFSNRKIFVVGGSRGIGAAIVRRFAAAGATVVFTYAASASAADQLAVETGAQALRADAGVRDEIIAAIRDAGPIDIFVYNAGLLVFGDPLTLNADEVDRMIDVNVRGAYFGSVEASRLMPEGGRILVIGSDTADSMPFPGLAAYVLTKAAMQGMTSGLARDLGPRDITVNVIQPGPTDTDMNPADGPRAADMLGPMAIKRYGTADEVASLTLYLAGTQARGITGAMHTIDGGFAA